MAAEPRKKSAPKTSQAAEPETAPETAEVAPEAAGATPEAAGVAGEAAGAVEGTVRADRVDLRQGGAARVEAESVSITQGGASRIDAREVSITQGGAGIVRTDSIRLEQASSAFAVLAGRATLAPGSRVFVLLARQSSGDVRPIVDWRGALAAVGGFLLLRRILGLMRSR